MVIVHTKSDGEVQNVNTLFHAWLLFMITELQKFDERQVIWFSWLKQYHRIFNPNPLGVFDRKFIYLKKFVVDHIRLNGHLCSTFWAKSRFLFIFWLSYKMSCCYKQFKSSFSLDNICVTFSFFVAMKWCSLDV